MSMNDDRDDAILQALSSGFHRLDVRLDTLASQVRTAMRTVAIGGASVALSLAMFMAVVIWMVATADPLGS